MRVIWCIKTRTLPSKGSCLDAYTRTALCGVVLTLLATLLALVLLVDMDTVCIMLVSLDLLAFLID